MPISSHSPSLKHTHRHIQSEQRACHKLSVYSTENILYEELGTPRVIMNSTDAAGYQVGSQS